MLNFLDIFVSDTYFAITYKAHIAIDCVLAYIIGFMFPLSIMAM